MLLLSSSLLHHLKDPKMLLALGFGSGLSLKAPGTAGSVVALLLMPVFSLVPLWAYCGLVFLAFWLGVNICNHASRVLSGLDHPAIVWDEFVGLWLALAIVPATWGWWILGFVLFRAFDILKPWPISVIDKKVGGGFGIMLDDVLAGVGVWVVITAAMLIT